MAPPAVWGVPHRGDGDVGLTAQSVIKQRHTGRRQYAHITVSSWTKGGQDLISQLGDIFSPPTVHSIKQAQEAVATESVYRGRRGEALTKEIERLALKEQQLRLKEQQLRDEKLTVLRQPCLTMRAESGGGTTTTAPKRVSFIETQAHPNNPELENMGERRACISRHISQQAVVAIRQTLGYERT